MSTLNCPACAAPCQPNARFCGQCGQVLVSRAAPAPLDIDFDPDDELDGPADPEADTRPAPLEFSSSVMSEEVDLLLDDGPGPAPVAAPTPALAPAEPAAATPSPDAKGVSAVATAILATSGAGQLATEAGPFTKPSASPELPPPELPPSPPSAPQSGSGWTAALYAALGFAVVALTAALAWWLWGGKPAVSSPSVAGKAPVIAVEQASPGTAPAVVAPAAPAVPAVPVTTPPPAEAPADASAVPPATRSAAPAARPAGNGPVAANPAAGSEPPWPHGGSREPAPPSLSRPASPPTPVAEGLGPLRAALRQCDRDDNLLTRGVCVVRARHQHCGSHWGKVPECPMSNRNNDPYTSN
ncbi:hypothetical protein ACDW_02640 [Acidovorax sp. DW039]|uniref:zinc ribbon domain-containing protein n=1 Tax=Acidovorax sp. DW039 TaxID=3095606 RepID=UPI00308C474B|nr:hypothetical protein ACDW_02640 [Acidovorax sp. DW039]